MNMRLLRTIVVDSVTRLCDFWKFFVTYFLRKVTRMYFCFWAILKNNSLQVKTDVASFWATFGNFCQTFILTSGYTGWRCSHFRPQRTWVRVQPSAIFIKNVYFLFMNKQKTKIKKKGSKTAHKENKSILYFKIGGSKWTAGPLIFFAFFYLLRIRHNLPPYVRWQTKLIQTLKPFYITWTITIICYSSPIWRVGFDSIER